MKITVRQLMEQPFNHFMNVKEMITIKYDDGNEITVTPGTAGLNRMVFKLVDAIKGATYKSDYCVSNFFEEGLFGSSTVNDALECIMEDAIDYIGIDHPNLQEESLRLFNVMYVIVNDIYILMDEEMITGVMGINAIDLIEIENDEELQVAIGEAKRIQTGKSIQNVHGVLDRILMTKDAYINNPLAKLYRADVLSKGQIKQLIGMRGFITEIDSTIFKKPVLNSFVSGLGNIYEMAIESRSAAFALLSSTSSIKLSESLSRKLQLAAMYLENIAPGDCGTTEYINFYVTPPSPTYKGDLPNLIGAYYKIDHSDDLKRLTIKDKHVIGKTILLRNVLKCKHPDKHSVCSVCFGGLSFNVPVKANVGHITSTNMSQAGSQALLSTKHVIGSAESSSITLDKVTSQVFNVKGNGYRFNKELFKNADSVKLMIQQSQCNGLKEIRDVDIINKINFEKLSNISELTVLVQRNGEEEYYPCRILQNDKYGSLTKKLLVHVANTGITIDENDNVILDITKFRSSAVVIMLQEKEYSFYTLVKDIKSKIETRNILKGGKSSESPDELLSSLFMIVNKKLNINIANLSGMIYTYMAKELETGNYDLGRDSEDPQLISLIRAIDRRSASAAFGYNAMTIKIFKPFMFDTVNVPSHPLDCLYFKKEAVAEFAKPALTI